MNHSVKGYFVQFDENDASTLTRANYATDAIVVKYLQNRDLLPTTKTPAPFCELCKRPMSIIHRKNSNVANLNGNYKLKWRYKCTKTRLVENGVTGLTKRVQCPNFANPLKGSYFANMNITFCAFMQLVCGFVLQTKADELTACMKENLAKTPSVSRKTVGTHLSHFRQICAIAQSHEQFQIGGPGRTVEIDESYRRIDTTHADRRTKKF
jgi:hypothetical protein